MNSRTLLLVSTTLAGSLFAGAAFAQTPAPVTQQGASGPAVLQNAAPNSPGAQATAQTGANATTNPQASITPQDNLIGEIIVTAEKREQSLQTVPVAISAFTSQKRDLIGIESVVDQTNYTPGFSYSQSDDRLSMRGVGRLTNIHAADSGTAIYTDGVFLTSATQAGRSPLFIERTEVLRGPQGTLYGRNAIGGAFNLISKRPDKEYSGEARLTFGNYDVERLDATVSVPLTDHLRTRFNFTRNYQGDGFDHNIAGGNTFKTEAGNRDELYYEAQVEGEIGKLDFWGQWNKNVWHDSAPPGIATGGTFAPNDTVIGTASSSLVSPTFGFTGGTNLRYIGGVPGSPNLLTGDLRSVEHDTQFQDTLHDNNTFITHLTYHFPTFDLKYVGGWSRYHYQWNDDGDGTSVQSFTVPLSPTAPGFVPVAPGVSFNCYQLQALGACGPATVSYAGNHTTYDEIEEYYSHDVTITSTWDGPLQYIAGVYFYHEKGANPVQAYAPTTPQLVNPIAYPGLGLPTPALNPLRQYAYSNDYFGIESKAVYGQLDYKLTDTIKLTGGLRYTQDDKKATEEERFVFYGVAAPLTQYGTLAPAIDITPVVLGTPTAAQLAAQGGNQQGVVGAVTYDPTTGRYKRRLQDGSNDATGTAGVEWTPDRKTLVYGKYSRGYKAFGLYAAQLPSTFSPFPYSKPEQMDNFEVGLKRDWTRRIQTNITAFYDPYYNAQVPLSVQQGASPAFTLFYNVPRSILQGVEFEGTWAATDRLTFLLTYAYLDAHVTKGSGVSDPNDPSALQPGAVAAGASSQGAVDSITGQPTRGQNIAGAELPFSPKNKVAFNANYVWSLGNLGDLTGSASYLWRDVQYSSFFNRSYNESPSQDQVDLRLTFSDSKKRFDIVGYARNVTDNTNIAIRNGARTSTGIVYSTYTLTDPRTYGVELRARF